MNRTTKQLGTAALALAAGLAGLYGGAQAWDAFHLPRPAWNWETKQIADELTDTRLRTLLLEKQATEQSARDLAIQIQIMQTANPPQPVPLSFFAAQSEKQDHLKALDAEIQKIQTQQ